MGSFRTVIQATLSLHIFRYCHHKIELFMQIIPIPYFGVVSTKMIVINKFELKIFFDQKTHLFSFKLI
jgi:hypothetical protein